MVKKNKADGKHKKKFNNKKIQNQKLLMSV